MSMAWIPGSFVEGQDEGYSGAGVFPGARPGAISWAVIGPRPGKNPNSRLQAVFENCNGVGIERR